MATASAATGAATPRTLSHHRVTRCIRPLMFRSGISPDARMARAVRLSPARTGPAPLRSGRTSAAGLSLTSQPALRAARAGEARSDPDFKCPSTRCAQPGPRAGAAISCARFWRDVRAVTCARPVPVRLGSLSSSLKPLRTDLPDAPFGHASYVSHSGWPECLMRHRYQDKLRRRGCIGQATGKLDRPNMRDP